MEGLHISCCRFLPLECEINFTKNGQNGPFKGSPIVCQLAPHTRTVNALPIKSFLSGSNSHTTFLQHRPQSVLLIIHTSVDDLLDGSVTEPSKTMLASWMTNVLLGPFSVPVLMKFPPHNLSIISNSSSSCSN